MEIFEFINKDKVTESVEELEGTMKELEKYEKMEVKDITEGTEIVFLDEHICNDNLKIKDVDEAFMNPEEIIEENEKSMITLKECASKYDEDPDVKKARL